MTRLGGATDRLHHPHLEFRKMKRLILGAALVIAPLAVAVSALLASSHTSAATGNLGDLSTMQDILALAKGGNLPGAEKGITDFETAWDAAAPTLRNKDTATWTMIDHLADAAIGPLRDSPPSTTVEKLAAVLVGPSASVSNTTVVAFSTRNADGSPVPCEVALEEVRKVSATASVSASDKIKVMALQDKGIKRCNGDDDKRGRFLCPGPRDDGPLIMTPQTYPLIAARAVAPVFNRVPQVTVDFWFIKLLAVTVGETAADYLAVNLGLGLPLTSAIMSGVLVTEHSAPLKRR
jgi:hypothetical protein